MLGLWGGRGAGALLGLISRRRWGLLCEPGSWGGGEVNLGHVPGKCRRGWECSASSSQRSYSAASSLISQTKGLARLFLPRSSSVCSCKLISPSPSWSGFGFVSSLFPQLTCLTHLTTSRRVSAPCLGLKLSRGSLPGAMASQRARLGPISSPFLYALISSIASAGHRWGSSFSSFHEITTKTQISTCRPNTYPHYRFPRDAGIRLQYRVPAQLRKWHHLAW